ncbi:MULTISPECIES: hypothetical protein [Alphaproteobacteria]|uniref:Uncharacterized protein n=2 Tax=Alphaproteobacteria TaxID=28211 RepID=A0A512HCN4_9HYPH|nr:MULTISPECIES: hypothetical protein [Alphaproteobacteria]GEO83130.1 hypothetical protein RNA01_00620 [Ciceribacter naphthalenivorans]GLR20475.1 hypothetical protein GCM10007920_02590 [Ciceribacter naphthalenivorans]GLT03331.1 hypothetical protein GCM10007926_02590 [Sphingomonas psychrolutea]
MRPLTRAEIVAHPQFPAIERQIAEHLIGIHLRTPRLSRLKASHRKWLMTHSLFALSLQRRDDDPLSGLTATRFVEIVMKLGAASRNTATAFLAELVAYKFLRDIPDVPDRRVRVLETTETAYDAMASWFMGHMACLDRLDGGSREAMASADQRIFRIAQPYAARHLVEDPLWRDPVESIGHFLWSDLGGMVLHDLIARIPGSLTDEDRIEVGPLSLPELSHAYMISATNLKRMFKKAETEGLLGWQLPRRRGAMWLSRRFVEDYFSWQSAKFAALEEAFHYALSELNLVPAGTEPQQFLLTGSRHPA